MKAVFKIFQMRPESVKNLHQKFFYCRKSRGGGGGGGGSKKIFFEKKSFGTKGLKIRKILIFPGFKDMLG